MPEVVISANIERNSGVLMTDDGLGSLILPAAKVGHGGTTAALTKLRAMSCRGMGVTVGWLLRWIIR